MTSGVIPQLAPGRVGEHELRPLPYGEPERLVVRQSLTSPATPSLGFSEGALLDYRAASRTLEDLVEYHTMSFTLLGGREAERKGWITPAA